MSPRKPIYYLRVFRNGRWYFLWKTKFNKIAHCMEPIWWEESRRGDSKPYLYKTLTIARNCLENYRPPDAIKADVAVWSNGENANA